VSRFGWPLPGDDGPPDGPDIECPECGSVNVRETTWQLDHYECEDCEEVFRPETDADRAAEAAERRMDAIREDGP